MENGKDKVEYELLSDLYKEAHGFRPSAAYFEAFNALSDEQKKEAYDSLIEEANFEADLEREQMENALLRLQNHLFALRATHKISLADAVRWDMDAVGAESIDEYEYLSGVGYYTVKRMLEG